MKNKLNVFAAVFLAFCLGTSLGGTVIISSIDLILVIFNLWLAGFFEY